MEKTKEQLRMEFYDYIQKKLGRLFTAEEQNFIRTHLKLMTIAPRREFPVKKKIQKTPELKKEIKKPSYYDNNSYGGVSL